MIKLPAQVHNDESHLIVDITDSVSVMKYTAARRQDRGANT